NFLSHELGGDIVGDARAPVLAVANIFREAFAAEILARCDIFHLGRDDAAAGIVHLADVGAGPRAKNFLADIGEGGDAARTVGAKLAVVLGPHLALGDFLDVAARPDPRRAQFSEPLADVDACIWVGIGAARVIDAHRGLV